MEKIRCSKLAKYCCVWVFVVSTMLGMLSCEGNKNTTHTAPQLKILSTTVIPAPQGFDSLIWVDIAFEDEDGDLGLTDADTLGSFAFGKYDFFNLKVYMQYCDFGMWNYALNPLAGNGDSITFHERFPSLTPLGRNKKVIGDLRLTIPAQPYGFVADSVRFLIQLSDRSKKRSNWDTTSTIFLKH